MERVRTLKKKLAAGSSANDLEASEQETVPGTDTDYLVLRATLRGTARILNVSLFDVGDRIQALQEEAVQLGQEIAALADSEEISADTLKEMAELVDDVPVLVAEIEVANPNRMRQLVDQLRKQFQPIAVLLAAASDDGKVLLVAGVTRDLIEQGVSAGNWVKDVAPIVGGGGGGRPDLAQAGGRQPEKITEALETARNAMKSQLESRS
jgi:alanyl-tRNA synthetase